MAEFTQEKADREKTMSQTQTEAFREKQLLEIELKNIKEEKQELRSKLAHIEKADLATTKSILSVKKENIVLEKAKKAVDTQLADAQKGQKEA